ncbi:VOC family protein [Erythrobacter alti]|uniref:VOC family protein n=1 Tax=Erythrobacter alti TaxID=1896145 RepID=UPI0030F49D9B
MQNPHTHEGIFQMSWVVNDLEEAARRWHRTTGIGPFLVNRHIPIANPVYCGAPGPVDFSTAIAQAGPVQVELVQQHDDNPSCYRDSIGKGSEGMHHIAMMASDYDAAVRHYEDQGFSVASSGLFGTVRFCYIDCRKTLGHMVELLEDSPSIRSFFAAIARAADEWDGAPATLLREL